MRPIKNIAWLILGISVVLLCLQCSKSKKADPPPQSIPAPSLTSVSPTEGIIGDPVSISGTNLDKADQISFNGTASKIIQNSGTLITTVIPQGVTAGTAGIVVHTSGGSSNQLSFNVLKTPDHIDSLPPVVLKTIPSSNFTEYPVLIYGTNLSGVIKITFNDKDAAVFTNNSNVITTSVPKDLPAGTVTIKIKTAKGTASSSFQVNGPSTATTTPVLFSIVDIPPPGYVPTISNDWSCGLFSGQTGDSLFLGVIKNLDSVTGKFKFHYDSNAKYNNVNYVEFTDIVNGQTYAGMFSSKFANPCVLNMVLISSTTGTISTCSFDKTSGFPDPDCQK